MSVANLITLSRGVAIVPIIVLLASGHRWAAWWLFGFACLTDLIDGLVARARNEVTRLGQVLDPLVDKALYVSILCLLFILGDIPALAFALFLLPQVAIGVGALLLRARKNAVQQARTAGKVAAALAFGALAFLLVEWPGGVELFYMAIGATFAGAVDYGVSAIRLTRNT